MPSSQEVIGIPESLCLSLKSRKLSVHVRQSYCGFPSPCSSSAPAPAHRNQLLLFLLWPVRAPRALMRSAAWLSASSHWVGHSPVTPSPPVGLGVPGAASALESGSARGPPCHSQGFTRVQSPLPARVTGPGASTGLERNRELQVSQNIQGGAEWVCVREQTRVRLR